MDGNNMYMPKGAVPVEETYIPKGATPIEPSMPITAPQNDILTTLGGIGKKVVNFAAPNITKFVSNLPSDIQAPQTPQEVAVNALGPLGTTFLGSERQKRAQGAAGEALSYALPVKGLTGSLGEKIAQAGFQGAKYGAINAVSSDKPTNPIQLAQDIKDKVQMSAALSAAFPIAGAIKNKTGEALTKAFVGTPETIIRKVVKVSDKESQDFSRAFKTSWDKEIIKRDGEKLKGKNFEQIVGYFQDKAKEVEQKIGELLGKNTGTIKTADLISEAEKTIASLSPTAGNVGTSETIGKLNTILEELKQNPEQLTLLAANRIKRQLQDVATYGKNAGIQDKPLQELASTVRSMIESKAPNIHEQNMLSRLYGIAIEGAHIRSEQAMGAKNQTILEKLAQVIPFAAGAGVGTVTGNPMTGILVGTGAGAAGLVRQELQKPEYQTRILDVLLKQRPDLITRFGSKEKAMEYIKRALIIGAQDQLK